MWDTLDILFIEPFARWAERWVVARRIRRYREKAELQMVQERFDTLIEMAIKRAGPDPVDFSAVRSAYVVATRHVDEVGLAAFDQYFSLRDGLKS